MEFVKLWELFFQACLKDYRHTYTGIMHSWGHSHRSEVNANAKPSTQYQFTDLAENPSESGIAFTFALAKCD